MNRLNRDECVIIVLLQRFCEYRLPRILRIKRNVDGGEILSNSDLSFLTRGHKSTQQIIHLIDNHPKYKEIFKDIFHLYHHVTRRALDNEQRVSEPNRSVLDHQAINDN